MESTKRTIVYFVRHAEPNYENHNDEMRELNAKGLEDRKLVTNYLMDKEIDVILSSPYKRAVDTVKHFAEQKKMPIDTIPDFRERKIDSVWIDDFNAFCKKQWSDFSYKLSDGETLQEVQDRNIKALEIVLQEYPGKHIVVGSHGTALSTIINYYDRNFGYDEFEQIRSLMPWIVKFVFDGKSMIEIEKIDVFK